jgi:hypothetical protein
LAAAAFLRGASRLVAILLSSSAFRANSARSRHRRGREVTTESHKSLDWDAFWKTIGRIDWDLLDLDLDRSETRPGDTDHSKRHAENE